MPAKTHVVVKTTTLTLPEQQRPWMEITGRQIPEVSTTLYDFRFKRYGSNSGFNVFDDIDLDIWHMLYWLSQKVGTGYYNNLAKFSK